MVRAILFRGFAINYMTTTNPGIAVVTMIKFPLKTNEIDVSECFYDSIQFSSIQQFHSG